MKLTKKKSAKAASKTKTPKKSFNFQDFRRSFESLDSQNYGSWPTPVKVTVFLLLVGVIAALVYAFPVSSKMDEITAASAEQETLLTEYRDKESKARHLAEYEAQVAQMEKDFNELVNQLPKDTRIPELLEGINMTGVGSNIRFQDISVENEVEQEFFIEQPIRIAALGDYHEFGAFISGLAALPRIITIHDFEVNNPQPTLEEIPQLNLVLQVKTYRSKDADQIPTESSDTPAATDNQGE
ncbi:type 4a pilus biogenesis protein PilO [Psychrobacter sp. I-STPA10]|uniref:type 4a pilus biogenesis protein PilO n=1 Tax=Psychrobacter sp. I-STPA10 TaxID=2585769 RepID=UPI003FA6FD8E